VRSRERGAPRRLVGVELARARERERTRPRTALLKKLPRHDARGGAGGGRGRWGRAGRGRRCQAAPHVVALAVGAWGLRESGSRGWEGGVMMRRRTNPLDMRRARGDARRRPSAAPPLAGRGGRRRRRGQKPLFGRPSPLTHTLEIVARDDSAHNHRSTDSLPTQRGSKNASRTKIAASFLLSAPAFPAEAPRERGETRLVRERPPAPLSRSHLGRARARACRFKQEDRRRGPAGRARPKRREGLPPPRPLQARRSFHAPVFRP
jgi:hypothetical protein